MCVVSSLVAGGFSYRLHVGAGFWFVAFRLGVSVIVSTRRTDGIFLHSLPVVTHGQGESVLVGETLRWTVVGGFQPQTYW